MKKQSSQLPALFLGRFQPFHLGHLDGLSQVFAKENYVIIGIGNTEDDYVPQNPFTAGERYQMIEAALLGQKIEGKIITRERFTVVPVRNIHHYSLWVKHVETLLPPFGRVYSGSPVVQRLFMENRGHEVVPLHFNKKISATEIRKNMVEGKKWKHLVPEAVARLIVRWDGVNRLLHICK